MAKFGKFDGNEGTALECLGVSNLGCLVFIGPTENIITISPLRRIFLVSITELPFVRFFLFQLLNCPFCQESGFGERVFWGR